MRLSVFWLTFFTVSATFVLSHTANAQTPLSTNVNSDSVGYDELSPVTVPPPGQTLTSSNVPRVGAMPQCSPADTQLQQMQMTGGTPLPAYVAPTRDRVLSPSTPLAIKPEEIKSQQTPTVTSQVNSESPSPKSTALSPSSSKPPKNLQESLFFPNIKISAYDGQVAQGTTPSKPTSPTTPAKTTPNPTKPQQPPQNSTPIPTPEETSPPIPKREARPTSEAEPQVLVAEVLVSGVTGELQDEVYRAISTQPGRPTTRTQLQQDINAIFATGYFKNVKAVPEDTPLGVRVTFEVQSNPVLDKVIIEGQKVLPKKVAEDAFADQYGKTLNLRRFEEGIKKVNKWYQDNGYVLAQFVGTPQVRDEGIVTLVVAEGEVESISVRFLNKEGESTDSKGQTIKGRTRSYIVTREVQLKPGDVFNRNIAQKDVKRLFNLGIFEDVRLGLEPGSPDPLKAKVIVNIIEKNTGSLALGAGYGTASGLFGTLSYQEQNLQGRNLKFGGELQVAERGLLFDLNFTDPWIAGDPYRTSYSINLFRRRFISVIFDGGNPQVYLPNGDQPRVVRTGGSWIFTRPLVSNPFEDALWTASIGLQYQNVFISDSNGRVTPRDQYGNLLAWNRSGMDDLIFIQGGISFDNRNDPQRPTKGSVFRFGMEQSIPTSSNGILMNRWRAGYSYYIPVTFTKFSPGPQTLAFNIQGGTVMGNLPPYEAFPLGGANSVRGYGDGEVGSGRSYLQGTVEYRFPLVSFLGGVLFLDAATDLGSGKTVPGSPAGIRGKPGSGLGYGVGLRVQSPVGPLRIDWGFNAEGGNQINFAVGERF